MSEEKTYKVVIQFADDFIEAVTKIKNFEKSYNEKLMRIYALPEKNESDMNQKQEELTKLELDYLDISGILFTKDSYDAVNMYDEILLEFNTYSKYDSQNNVFIFNDKIAAIKVFIYIAKIYPNFLNYLKKYTLSYNNNVLIDFLKLK